MCVQIHYTVVVHIICIIYVLMYLHVYTCTLYALTFSPPPLCMCVVADIATVVGYLAVSRPFLNLSDPRHKTSTHSEIMLVSLVACDKKDACW